MKGSDVAVVLALLEEGRRDEARRVLVELMEGAGKTGAGPPSTRTDVSAETSSSAGTHLSAETSSSAGTHLSAETLPSAGTHLSAETPPSAGTHLSAEPPPSAGTHLSAEPPPSSGTHLSAETPPSAEAPPELAEAALRTLDHVQSGSTSLRSGRVDELVGEARAAAESMPRALPGVVLAVGSLFQAAYRFTGDAVLREEALRICGIVADRMDRPDLAVQARALMGNIHMMRGALHRAMEHFDAALALADAAGKADAPSAAMAHQFRGYVLFEWNRLDEAEEALLRAWELTSRRGVRSGVARVMARLRSAAGDQEGAESWLRRLEEVVSEPLTLRNREWLSAVRLRLSLGTGDLRPMEAWLGAYDYHASTLATLDPPALLARLHELEQVLALLEATARWPELAEVAPVILAATRQERRWFAARTASAQAVALEALGRTDEADRAMDEALELGAEGAFVRAYIEGSRHRSLLLQRAARARGREAAQRVLRAAPELDPEGTRLLTPTQITVLDRVAAGESNKTIAREMDISVSTVKTHLRAVFSRLDVSSRTQAVARAREQGWL